MSRKIRMLGVVVASALAGCTTENMVRDRPLIDGATRSYREPVAVVADAATKAIPEVGLKVKSETKKGDDIILMAERGVTGWSWGEIVRVAIIPNGSGSIVRMSSPHFEGHSEI